MDPKLYLAATSGDVGFLENVADGANMELLLSKAPHENTALHIAARFGHADFAEKILQLCSHLVKMKNSKDDTALHCAAVAGCSEMVEILVDYELRTADHVEEGGSSAGLLRMQNKKGDTALHQALRNQREDMAIKMLQVDPKLPFVVNNANESSFLLAAKEDMEEVVKEMLSIDPSANSVGQQVAAISNTSSGFTAEEKRELIRMQDNTGRTALHYAAWRNNAKMIRMILITDNRHVPYIADNNGHSPLHVAVASGMQCSMLELLEHCPDTLEQLDTSGRNALHIALLNRRSIIIRQLLKLPHIGGLLNGPDKEGNTPVHFASKENTSLFLLGDSRADLTMRNEDGQTALALNSYYRLLPRRDPAWSGHRDMPNVIPKTDPPPEEGSAFQRAHQVLLVVASLIATVTFAAAFTMPGGYRSSNEPNPGKAVLVRTRDFKAFLFFDTLAMCLSMAAIFCYILGWKVWPHRVGSTFLTWGNGFTMFACLLMLFAFSYGVSVAAESTNPLVGAICLAVPFLVAVPFSVSACTVLYLLCRIQRTRKASAPAHKIREAVPV